VVEDQLEPRIRMPTDLLRCVTASLEIALLIGIGLLAKATANGFQFDVVRVSEHLARGLISPLHSLALVALIVLPAALAIRLIVISQIRTLIEAVVIAVVAAGVTITCNVILGLGGLADLFKALAHSGTSPGATLLDPYLAALAAFLTVIGLTGRPKWRAWFWVAIVFYCVTSLVEQVGPSTVLSLLITLLIGSAVGSGLRYLIGTASERPTAAEIAAALSETAAPLVEICRVPDSTTENRRYAARSRDGKLLDVTVFDRDQQAADAFYRIYRRLRLPSQVSRSRPLTVSRAIERRALMTYAVEDTGVPTPKLLAAVRVGAEAAAIATAHLDGMTLAELPRPPSDRQLEPVWDMVLRLHRHRITHRSLTADHIQLSGPDATDVALLAPGDGDVAASDLQLRLDLAQLTATMALLVGPDRAAGMARHKLGSGTVAGLVPLLQPVVMHRTTRAALRRHKDVLPALRQRLMGAAPDVSVPPEQLERIRPRSVITLVAAIIAAYIVIGQFNRRHFGPVLRHSDWRWVLVALALSAVTYLGATWSLTGFVLEKLNFVRTLLAQLAGSFVTLVTPASVGGVALNVRYLNKSKVPPPDAVSSVGVSQVFAFTLHMLLLVIFIALTGGTHTTAFHPPSWSYIALAALGAVVLGILAVPAGRRLIRSRVAPALGQVVPRLLDIAQRPVKLAEGIGGALLLTLSYILTLYVSVLAVGGGHPQFAAVAVVFLTGNAIGSIVPTPGGLGAVEVALSGGLTTIAHVGGAYALSAVLLFRLITFWLPIPIGWVSLSYLQHHDAL
jgi:glycosyltransferase 2 family protein